MIGVTDLAMSLPRDLQCQRAGDSFGRALSKSDVAFRAEGAVAIRTTRALNDRDSHSTGSQPARDVSIAWGETWAQQQEFPLFGSPKKSSFTAALANV